MRVKEPDENDWKKMGRCLQYLKDTANDVLALSANNMRFTKWWVDESYACHKYCQSQAGSTMSIRQGSIYNTSQKQKINTKISTETEVVSTYNCIPQVIWTKYLLDGQGYTCEYELQQDNTSAIRLDINGKVSSGKRTKHMAV